MGWSVFTVEPVVGDPVLAGFAQRAGEGRAEVEAGAAACLRGVRSSCPISHLNRLLDAAIAEAVTARLTAASTINKELERPGTVPAWLRHVTARNDER